jgi:outer membrane protein OmpA-like peptidoglycan-associated protein
MKHLNILLVAVLFVIGMGVTNAQDQNNPWSIELGVNAVDFFPIDITDDGRFAASTKGGIFNEYFNSGDHWNIVPTVSEIKVGNYMGSGFTFVAGATFNKIKKVGDSSVDDLAYIAADGEIKYSFRELLNDGWFAPYIGVGGGYTWIDDIGFGTANALAGLDFWVAENLALTFQSTYKQAFEANYGATHFQHTAGLKFKFGGKDTDGDGIYDYEDECPLIPGLPEFNGCPDTDGDGLPDNLDECPLVPGPIANNGCPWADGDGDGVADKDDLCPDVTGTIANSGCPEVNEAMRIALNSYAKTILFDVDKSTIKKQSDVVLNDIIAIMKEYPTAKFLIEGHCDGYGTVELNNKLSKARAAAVENYLQENGIADDRLSSKGFGKSNPLYTNKTREGRAGNRRVEISLDKN